jgi:hypothetical protein
MRFSETLNQRADHIPTTSSGGAVANVPFSTVYLALRRSTRTAIGGDHVEPLGGRYLMALTSPSGRSGGCADALESWRFFSRLKF